LPCRDAQPVKAELRDFDNVNSSHWLGNDYNNELIAFLLIFYL